MTRSTDLAVLSRVAEHRQGVDSKLVALSLASGTAFCNAAGNGNMLADQVAAAEVVSKRWDAPYRSGTCRVWRKVKTMARREANRELWRLFETPGR